MKKMIIGSAQFGTNYGISNLGNGLEVTKIKSILKLAKKIKLNLLILQFLMDKVRRS